MKQTGAGAFAGSHQKIAPPPVRHPPGCKATSPCGSNNRSRRRLQTVFWMVSYASMNGRNPKSPVGSRVDENIHVGTDLASSRACDPEQVKCGYPKTRRAGSASFNFRMTSSRAHVPNIGQGASIFQCRDALLRRALRPDQADANPTTDHPTCPRCRRKMIGQHAGHHGLSHRHRADAHAGVVAAFGQDVGIGAAAIDGAARRQN